MLSDITPALMNNPSKIILETTTRCNLECEMCMKNTCKEPLSESDFNTELFPKLLPAISHAGSLVLNGIGEPLLVAELETYILRAKKTMPAGSWIGFQTNGLLLNLDRALSLCDAGLDKISVSIDSVDPLSYSRIRSGGEFNSTINALINLRVARTKIKTSLKIGVELVLRKDNLENLPDVLRFGGEKGIDFALVSHLFPYKPDLADLACYDANLDKAVEIFRKYNDNAKNEGIDLNNYKSSFMHFIKTKEQDRIAEILRAMTEEAIEQGITLNLSKLISTDQSLTEKTKEIFDEALTVAREYGIELKLPGLVPKSTRRCEFVEEGSAFISADGNVHPCYFLWHRYQCYINGLEKTVGPKSFGNLADNEFLEIWNSNEFLKFRKNVLKYEYPFCFNCNFALCDYVEGENFEQDCYINTEPCAACLWCMDIFQCLF